jgi:hypothetical protein
MSSRNPTDTAEFLLKTINDSIATNTDQKATLMALVRILLQKINASSDTHPAAPARSSGSGSTHSDSALQTQLHNIIKELQILKTKLQMEHVGGHGDGVFLDRAFIKKYTKMIELYYETLG